MSARSAIVASIASPVNGSGLVGIELTITEHVPGAAKLGEGEAASIYLTETEGAIVSGNTIVSDSRGSYTQGESSSWLPYYLPVGAYDFFFHGTGTRSFYEVRQLLSGNEGGVPGSLIESSVALKGSPTIATEPGESDESAKITNTKLVHTLIAKAKATIESWVTSNYAPLASPALTGNPTAPEQTEGNESTRLATTNFVGRAIKALVVGASQIGPEAVTEGKIGSEAVAATKLALAIVEAAAINAGSTIRRGHTNIATEQSRESTSFGTLATPDEVTVTLPENGLILVWYHALWCMASAGEGYAALFLGSNQVQVGAPGDAFENVEVAIAGSSNFGHLATGGWNLFSEANVSTPATELTTGQVVGLGPSSAGASTHQGPAGGPIAIYAAAGTYKVSMQFRCSGPSEHISAKNRRLWVEARGF